MKTSIAACESCLVLRNSRPLISGTANFRDVAEKEFDIGTRLPARHSRNHSSTSGRSSKFIYCTKSQDRFWQLSSP